MVVPILSLGFAIGVERAAAYDMGYDSACDEIDVVEAYGGYPRGARQPVRLALLDRSDAVHDLVSRTTRLPWPCRSTTAGSLRGEDIVTSIWQSYPVPALEGFLVQPRSLAHVPRRADGRRSTARSRW